MGVITASLGGIIRDILGHEPSIILRKEIYVTASLVESPRLCHRSASD